jgi:4-diphosphocytidyl-2-C-methyl-D-erythritol kinase
MVIEKAYAKINLFLNIIARRSDGYHDIESLMHSVSLHDVIKIEVKKHDTLRINVKTNAPELSDEKNNLVYIAAQKYAARYSVTDEILISLEKNNKGLRHRIFGALQKSGLDGYKETKMMKFPDDEEI